MEIRALESSLVKGMVEVLPAPGEAMGEEWIVAWLEMMGRALRLVYPRGEAPMPPAPPALLHPEDDPDFSEDVEPVEVEARVARAPSNFGRRLLERTPRAVKTPKAKKEPVRPAGAVPPDARLDKPKARDMILSVLGEASGPLRLKEIVEVAEKKFKGHGFKNLHGAMGFQISRMDGREIEWVEGVRGKEWKLMK